MSRIERLLDTLQRFYGRLPSPPSDPFVLFVWEVLSVHSSPRRRDRALAALKQLRALTPDAVWRLPRIKLEAAVMLAGPYLEQRLQSLRTGVDLFRRSPELKTTLTGPLPGALKALKPLPQMGEGGGYRMLLFAAGHAVLPVDARVSRVARRLGFGTEQVDFKRTARGIRQAIAAELPATPAAYRQAYVLLAHHGATTCAETDPHCAICPLLAECPEGGKRTRHAREPGS